jgi:hypothetical protein
MATRDVSRKELLFSDVPGDARKVRAILAEWGVEASSIRRLMREHRAHTAGDCEARDTKREPRPGKYAGHRAARTARPQVR